MTLLDAGTVLSIIIAMGVIIGVLLKLVTLTIRVHDNIMGDGNGRRPLRDLVEQHISDDVRAFRVIDDKLEAQDRVQAAWIKKWEERSAEYWSEVRRLSREGTRR